MRPSFRTMGLVFETKTNLPKYTHAQNPFIEDLEFPNVEDLKSVFENIKVYNKMDTQIVYDIVQFVIRKFLY